MGNCNHVEELQKLRKYVVDLAREIDYKNWHISLMEREIDEKGSRFEQAMKEINTFNMKLEEQNKNIECLKERLDPRSKDIECYTAVEAAEASVQAHCSEMDEKDTRFVLALKQINMFNLKLEEQNKKIECLKERTAPQSKDIECFEIAEASVQAHCSEKDNRKMKDIVYRRKPRSVRKRAKYEEVIHLKETIEDVESENSDAQADMQTLQTLTLKERIANDELQAARAAAIKALHDVLSNRSMFTIKRMGQIDLKPFKIMCAERCNGANWEKRSAKLCSLWQEKVGNPQWHPFKVVKYQGNDVEVIDDDDEMLKELRKKFSEDVYKAVVLAMLEMNEYNPSGRYPVSEVWNLKEGRKASLEEIIEYMGKQLKALKMKKKRNRPS